VGKASISAIVWGIVYGLAACGSNGDGDSQETGGSGGSGTQSGAQSGATSTGTGTGGNSAASGGINLDGGLGTGSSGVLDPDAACIADSREGSRSVVAMYFMIDISGSMLCPVPDDASDPCEIDPREPYSDVTRWTEASTALKGFFAAPESAGLWGGIGFFPRYDDDDDLACDADDYETPDEEIAELPGASDALGVTIDAQSPGGNTPTLPSLEGAVAHAQEWADAHPDHQAVVVYLTDGYPRSCGADDDTIPDAADAAEEAFTGMPSIRTYVLGVGRNLTDLDQIAVAGGTEAALFVDAGQDVTAQLTAALAAIREDVTVDCTYTIPDAPAGRTLDYGLVNVRYTNDAGETIDVSRDPSDSDCNEGWQYSDDRTQIMLCGDTCEAVQSDPNVELEVLFGCATVVDLR